MYRAKVSADSPPAPGDLLHWPGSGSEQATGRVVDARPNRSGDYELLVVVEIDAAQEGKVHLDGPDGPGLSFSDPPYGFSAES